MSRLMVGVSGVRGVVNETLTAEVARQFGRAFATMLGSGKTAVLGRDTRPSGPMIRDGVEAIVNPLDLFAIEIAIRLREQHGGEVIAVSCSAPASSSCEIVFGLSLMVCRLASGCLESYDLRFQD